MTQLHLRTALTALALAVGSPALVACGGSPPTEDVGATGTLNAALLTTGSDGATYQFPPGTTIGISGGSFFDNFPIDGSETSLTLNLPTGNFNVSLSFPSGTPQLLRTTGMITNTVDASWLDTQPVTVAINKDATTSLVLHFRVIGLGDITFDMGTLAIAIDVQHETTTQAAHLFEVGTYTNIGQIFGASAQPGLIAALGMTPGEAHPNSITFDTSGPWSQLNSQMICVSTQLAGFSTDGANAFSRALDEVAGGTGSACIIDAGANDQFFVNAIVVGPGPVDQQPFLPNMNYRFFLAVSGTVGDVYDGTTFHQSSLEVFTPVGNGQIQHQIFDAALNQETEFSFGGLVGNIRFSP